MTLVTLHSYCTNVSKKGEGKRENNRYKVSQVAKCHKAMVIGRDMTARKPKAPRRLLHEITDRAELHQRLTGPLPRRRRVKRRASTVDPWEKDDQPAQLELFSVNGEAGA